jgi:hypothetical protein
LQAGFLLVIFAFFSQNGKKGEQVMLAKKFKKYYSIKEEIEVKMKKTLIVFLLGLAVILTAACKSGDNFDITGTWTVMKITSDGQTTNSFTFSGNKEAGSVVMSGGSSSGSYTVVGDTVTFSITYGITAPFYLERFTGQVENDNSMKGDFNISLGDTVTNTGTWEASR